MDNIAKNKTVWIVVAIIVVALIAFFAMRGDQAITSDSESAQIESTEDVSSGSATKASGAASLSYQQALATYATRRIQFDGTCQANPNQVTYKDNTGIMLDNRSPASRTIKMGTFGSYSVKAWGFKVITLPDTYRASKTILVDCGTSQNVATILVQE